MIPSRYYRYACLVTAAANGGGNLFLLVFYRPLFELLGISQPVDLHYFVWMAGLSFTNGVLALLVFMDPEGSRSLLKVGIVGKGIFGLTTIHFYVAGDIHWFFLLFGIWDAIFAVIFWLYLMQLQAPDLSEILSGSIRGGDGSRGKAAILYFSLTGTGRGGVDSVRDGLESKGYTVDTIQIKPVETGLFRFPFGSALDFVRIGARAVLRVRAKIEPPDLPAAHDYDLIVVGSQTWFVGMSAPIEEVFMDPANHPFFRGRDAAVFVVCRGLWRRSQAMLIRHLEGAGASLVGARAYTHTGREPSRLFSLVAYLAYGETGRPAFLKWFLQPRYGLSEADLDELRRFGAALAER
ncbi:MAG: hypothetical protein OEN55_16250 [Alphaproteobacteria bacterium]|nr:hypothetical protein [Alphaproteobacteria bacterium]